MKEFPPIFSDSTDPEYYDDYHYPAKARTVDGNILSSQYYAEVTARAHWANGRDIPWKAGGILLHRLMSPAPGMGGGG